MVTVNASEEINMLHNLYPHIGEKKYIMLFICNMRTQRSQKNHTRVKALKVDLSEVTALFLPLTNLCRYCVLRSFIGIGFFDHTLLQKKNKDVPS